MGNIFQDIVQDIEIKPSKSKKVINWIVRIAVLLILGAFILGQLKIRSLNEVANFKKALDDNTKANVELKKQLEDGFKTVNQRIDKVYDDGNKTFNDFQVFNMKQLQLVVDYGQSNKDMLKRMLDINMTDKNKEVETQLEKAKVQPPVVVSKDTSKYIMNIIVKPVPPIKK